MGLNYTQTMIKIILPQAVKNILPALGNELIVLLKETSISGYIGLMDLTRGGDIIRKPDLQCPVPAACSSGNLSCDRLFPYIPCRKT